MFQRLRRPSTLLVAVLLPASLALAACGDDGGAEELSGLKAVEISGDVGSSPELDWKGIMKPEAVATEVVTEGDGPAIADGDRVQVEWTLANGYTHDVLWDTYADYRLSSVARVGSQGEPMSVNDVLFEVLGSQIKAGQKLGSRIAVTVGSDRVIGQFIGDAQTGPLFAQFGIGNQDGLLYVADLSAPAAPEGDTKKAPAWAPSVVEKDGVPSALDFSSAGQPSGDLRVATLVQGTGPKVGKGQQILAAYLGQVPGAKKPFDQNFTKGGLQAVVGGPDATVVKGWSRALVGLPVGSRVLIEIPPSLGYGKQPQKDQEGKATIPANSTLYFVVDILDVTDVEPAPEPEPEPSSSPEATETE